MCEMECQATSDYMFHIVMYELTIAKFFPYTIVF